MHLTSPLKCLNVWRSALCWLYSMMTKMTNLSLCWCARAGGVLFYFFFLRMTGDSSCDAFFRYVNNNRSDLMGNLWTDNAKRFLYQGRSLAHTLCLCKDPYCAFSLQFDEYTKGYSEDDVMYLLSQTCPTTTKRHFMFKTTASFMRRHEPRIFFSSFFSLSWFWSGFLWLNSGS